MAEYDIRYCIYYDDSVDMYVVQIIKVYWFGVYGCMKLLLKI